jgi:hypothetical protein
MKRFDEYELELYSSKNFKTLVMPGETKKMYSDPNRTYIENSFGFRTEEFSSKVDMIFAGCSLTYGAGIPEYGIWGNVLTKKLNLSSLNISKSGASISWIIDNLFKYFENYGNPKYLFCLFPDLYRHRVPVDGNHYAKKIKLDKNDPNLQKIKLENVEQGTIGDNNNFFTTLYLNLYNKPPKYVKLPYEYENIFSADLVVYENLRSIRHLESYCRAAGIQLIWSSWDQNFIEIAESLSENKNLKFSGFFNIYKNNFNSYRKLLNNNSYKDVFFNQEDKHEMICKPWHEFEECDCYLKCHEEYRSLEIESFDFGTDNKIKLYSSHPGRHWHLHCAESFEAKIKELGLFNDNRN